MTRDDVKRVIAGDPRYFHRTVRREDPVLAASVQDLHPGRPFVEALFLWLRDAPEPPRCAGCGGPVRFVGMREGYRRFCSLSCAARDDGVKQAKVEGQAKLPPGAVVAKRKATMLARHGAEHALLVPEFRERAFAKIHTPEAKTAAREKREATSLARHGTPHAMRNADIQARRRETNLRRFGVDTPLRLRRVIEHTKMVQRGAFRERLAERAEGAGLEPLFAAPRAVALPHPWRCKACANEFAAHMDNGALPRCPRCFEVAGSRGQSELRDFLRETLGFAELVVGERSLVPPKEIDLHIPSRRFAVEYNGLFWHSEEKVGRRYHLEKTLGCEAKGVRLVHVFENEWIARGEVVRSRLRALLGMSTERVHARSCAVEKLAHADYARFADRWHIQGSRNARAAYGLVRRDGTLVAAMSFGRPRYDARHEWEMLRFCVRGNTSAPGAAGRLLAAFAREHAPRSLVSYADRRWSDGGLYRALGFDLSHASDPDYFYTRDGTRLESRLLYQKHKLAVRLGDAFDPALSESENMRAAGFKRVFDCGSLVFSKTF